MGTVSLKFSTVIQIQNSNSNSIKFEFEFGAGALTIVLPKRLPQTTGSKFHAIHMYAWWRHQMAWWRHQMKKISALLAICAGNSPASVTRSFDVFFDLCLNKRLRKQSWGWWFETLSPPLWRHCNVNGKPRKISRHFTRSLESCLSNVKRVARVWSKFLGY